jgi:hypothetical protein
MPNLDALKSRVERAERNLKSAQTTREMESQTLVEMWRQIRERFEAQEGEIQVYRDKLDEVEGQYHELCRLVEALLGVVEKSAGKSSDDTVPRVTGLAEAMLEGRDAPEVANDEIEIADAEPPPPPAPRRAARDIRELVSRVSEARRGSVEDEDKPKADDERDIDSLRAEIEELGEKLGAARS